MATRLTAKTVAHQLGRMTYGYEGTSAAARLKTAVSHGLASSPPRGGAKSDERVGCNSEAYCTVARGASAQYGWRLLRPTSL